MRSSSSSSSGSYDLKDAMTDPNNDLEQVASPSGHTSETELDRDVSIHEIILKNYNYLLSNLQKVQMSNNVVDQNERREDVKEKNKNRDELFLSRYLRPNRLIKKLFFKKKVSVYERIYISFRVDRRVTDRRPEVTPSRRLTSACGARRSVAGKRRTLAWTSSGLHRAMSS